MPQKLTTVYGNVCVYLAFGDLMFAAKSKRNTLGKD